MKFKFPILIAAGLLVATVSKAQYSDRREGDRDRTEMAYNYNHMDHGRYEGYRRGGEYDGYCYDCRDYRAYCPGYYPYHRRYFRPIPLFPPHPVVVLGY